MRRAVVFLLMILLAAGCTSAPPLAPPTPEQPRSLAAAKGPEAFTLQELLTELAAYLNADSNEPARSRLAGLYERWWGGLKPERIPEILQDDLNGDGSPDLATSIGGFKAAPGESPWVLLLIWGKPGSYQIDHVVPKLAPVRAGFLYRATLVAKTNFTPDDAIEMLWHLQTVVGATGGRGWVVTVNWYPGRLRELVPAVHMPNLTGVRLENQELVFSGGISGGAAAAAMQGSRTDRFLFQRDGWHLSDRKFAPSPQAYHRLIDGIVAESIGKTAEAETAYREAAEPDRLAIDTPRKLKEPERLPLFADAVKAMARIRLSALRWKQGDGAGARGALAGGPVTFAGVLEKAATANSAADLCNVAAEAARHGELTHALNLPGGLGNPEWTADNICGPVSFPDLE